LIELANHHPRVDILRPGPGVGGHCLAVDPYFIIEAAPEVTPLIATARAVNSAKPEWVVGKVAAAVAGNGAPVIAALGLAFKPNIDDLRESPAREVVGLLADTFPGGLIRVAEPHVDALPPELAARANVALVPSLDGAVAGADAVVLLVDHRAFAEQPALPEGTPVIDTRGIWR
ncbi:MAG: UDP-N-acetyl-D-mannosamine dehydrogenase, partial [Bifidobacteriaceae bacterium]|nr:UDP-N-acetyl-D-mannosamine dehydrogenase [Bifidobacteriaceae bacterium]